MAGFMDFDCFHAWTCRRQSAQSCVDGMPNPLLVVFLVLEIGFGVVGFMMIRGYRNQ